MEDYNSFSYRASRSLTLAYSTSFGMSSRLFAPELRRHIYAIYGMVRVADEIVDTYEGSDKLALLSEFELATYAAMKRGYSTNPILHAFAKTSKKYGITKTIVTPFFKSMKLDLKPQHYDQQLYKTYIYGSAEVIGLMCLRVFCDNDSRAYASLEAGARALGAAYQKINFLRDFASDYQKLGRTYFPKTSFDTFTDSHKNAITKDIRRDINNATTSLVRLPKSSRVAVLTSLSYYSKLLERLEQTPASSIKRKRIRINNIHKSLLFATTALGQVGKRA